MDRCGGHSPPFKRSIFRPGDVAIRKHFLICIRVPGDRWRILGLPSKRPFVEGKKGPLETLQFSGMRVLTGKCLAKIAALLRKLASH
jgi:hypothetical protein